MSNNLSKLILGTVQFGLNYGINNTEGKVNDSHALEILQYARTAGIKTLDTAAGYGNAEDIIGQYHSTNPQFDIITKFDTTDWEASIIRSTHRLQVEKVKYAMFHSFDAYKKDKNILSEITGKGKGRYFDFLGVSVYTNDQLEMLLDDAYVDLIQLPFNMLDNDLQRGQILQRLKEKGKTIHTRSVFLQGLFFMDLHSLDPQFDGIRQELQKVKNIASENALPMHTLALQYALSKNYIDGVLIGVDNKSQLEESIRSLDVKISAEVFEEIDKIKVRDTELLNPSKWQKK